MVSSVDANGKSGVGHWSSCDYVDCLENKFFQNASVNAPPSENSSGLVSCKSSNDA